VIPVRFNDGELRQIEAATIAWRARVKNKDGRRAAWIRWAAISKAKEVLEDVEKPPEPAS
jgi:hypothetical protein